MKNGICDQIIGVLRELIERDERGKFQKKSLAEKNDGDTADAFQNAINGFEDEAHVVDPADEAFAHEFHIQGSVLQMPNQCLSGEFKIPSSDPPRHPVFFSSGHSSL